jgi:hypothetical protein
VEKLQQFEDIRYPDKILSLGAQMLVDWSTSATEHAFAPSPPLYHLVVNDLDRLIGRLFVVSSRNPLFFTSYLAALPHAREIIARDNPVTAQLLPP